MECQVVYSSSLNNTASQLHAPPSGALCCHMSGRTWGQVFPTAVRNPDAKVHAISLPSPDGRLALAFNDHDRPFHGMAKGRGGASGKRRDTLTLSVSPNSGASWKPVNPSPNILSACCPSSFPPFSRALH